jgi:hypothetical protein
MKINTKAICCRKQYEDIGGSAKFAVDNPMTNLKDTMIAIGPLYRRVLLVTKENNQDYLICSSFVSNFKEGEL